MMATFATSITNVPLLSKVHKKVTPIYAASNTSVSIPNNYWYVQVYRSTSQRWNRLTFGVAVNATGSTQSVSISAGNYYALVEATGSNELFGKTAVTLVS